MRLRPAQATQQNLVLKSLVLTLLRVTTASKLWKNGSYARLPDTKFLLLEFTPTVLLTSVTPFSWALLYNGTPILRHTHPALFTYMLCH